MTTFSPIGYDENLLSRYVALFSCCFPGIDKFSSAYLRWLYCENPAGTAIGFDAWDGEKLAAHYVCIPAHALVGGSIVSVLLSLNTATHPSYQGRGLFTQLAEMTYSAAAAKGFDSVYGVANANSTPGFIRKLGFHLIEPLSASIGVGRLNMDASIAERVTSFERHWSPEELAWRCANPVSPVQSKLRENFVQFHVRGHNMLLPAYAELSAGRLPPTNHVSRRIYPPTRLFLGLIPSEANRPNAYFAIPQRLRPSPLNFIYRTLSGRIPNLERGKISLSFLDFDAY